MATTPTFLQDSKDLLTQQGFTIGETWYHGTSSALVSSIKENGLKRSGDRDLKAAAKKTMATIGNNYTESVEPVFLTQSKELAFYWAEQTVRDRSVRIEGEEQPVVLAVKLSEELNSKVKPDVGAASLLLVKEGEHFMAYLAGIYQANGFDAPEIDLMKADRLEYLNKLGMAYYDADIDAACLNLVSE
ncbi:MULTISPECIES: hypothetical protein [unclassified Neptuniibacter]|uniref:hypothetical protein n=1 Tax=unclassified Neptuniibacter TaxID=2630693 RepID=UPI000C673051|nr:MULTISPECIES: hypothetical protein [unclassified Neptuniibacter]MAY42448.1 hypothetical protein [Oceanospirillaceae bacterium]|tara:strand:- start:33243 stop:33806 length:564 start_codon:yes stop_codon:yes gene_type:complete